MRRFGDTYWQLYRAVVHLNETFDNKTLLSWIQGERVPRSVASFSILRRIERRYRLSEGYFKEKLPHQARSLYGHNLGDISPAERRRISLHLPEDFNSLPFDKREEILDWVRRVIISGSTEYRRYQAAAISSDMPSAFPASPMAAAFFPLDRWTWRPASIRTLPQNLMILICSPALSTHRRDLPCLRLPETNRSREVARMPPLPRPQPVEVGTVSRLSRHQ